MIACKNHACILTKTRGLYTRNISHMIIYLDIVSEVMNEKIPLFASILKALGHDISEWFLTKFKLIVYRQVPVINGTMTAKACRAIIRNVTREMISFHGNHRLYVNLSS